MSEREARAPYGNDPRRLYLSFLTEEQIGEILDFLHTALHDDDCEGFRFPFMESLDLGIARDSEIHLGGPDDAR